MVAGSLCCLGPGENGVTRADNQRLFRAGDPDLEVIDASGAIRDRAIVLALRDGHWRSWLLVVAAAVRRVGE